jgi:hypothetical protein
MVLCAVPISAVSVTSQSNHGTFMNFITRQIGVGLLLIGLGVSPCFADIDCGGIPVNVRNWGGGLGYLGVTFPGSSSVWVLCSNNQTLGNLTVADCKNILATLLTAIAAQRQIDILFSGYTDCASVPSFDITLPGKIQYVTLL